MPKQQESSQQAEPTSQQGNGKPRVIITGAAGNIGQALTQALQQNYCVISLDRKISDSADASYEFDLTSTDSVHEAIAQIAQEQGQHFAAVIHLAAYFDFTGEKSPLYEAVNVRGTRNLLRALKQLEIERFIYSSTMLVHKPGTPGEKTTEDTPVEPSWAYPESKAETEAVIRAEADMPITLLRLAGLYDEQTSVPTLAHQIARIYEEDIKSHLYSGDTGAGQAFIHRDDMMDAFVRTVDRRKDLPHDNVMLVGEEDVVSYETLQNRLGKLIHGEEKWRTITLPEPLAKAGAWVQEKAEPIIPDDFDHGEKPFIRPFMIDMASDHYDLDCSRARDLLGWHPQHNLYDTLEAIVANLKKDPLAWYNKNRITPPDWMTAAAEERQENPDQLLHRYQHHVRQEHRQSLWARFLTMGLGVWLVTSPPAMGYSGTGLAISDGISGIALLLLGFIGLSWKHDWARWAAAAVGAWLLFAPLIFHTASAAGYMNNTAIGMLAIGLALATRPSPGVSPTAALTGPEIPPGWDHNPSSWLQRIPIIVLALVGLCISRYLAAYQLGHIDAVWEPFFAGSATDPQNGTEEIITSKLSEAFPIPDAGLGATVYALEILAGLIGATNRWRTSPWLVVLFGLLIVPMGAVSIGFIIIQPIMFDTWCTLCLIQAAAMTLQIPYFLNELVATGQFLKRRKAAGRPVLQIFFVGDTDTGETRIALDRFYQPPLAMLKSIVGDGVSVAWNLIAGALLGIWLMLTRATLGNEASLANWEHVLGALVFTVSICALAEVARFLRFLLIPLGLLAVIIPPVYDAHTVAMISGVLTGLLLMGLAFPKGPIKRQYGGWKTV